MKSSDEVRKQLRQLESEIADTYLVEKEAVIKRVRLIAQYSVTAAELKDSLTGERRTYAAKYYDPISGATWSGRGRPPSWFNEQDCERYRLPPDGDDTQ